MSVAFPATVGVLEPDSAAELAAVAATGVPGNLAVLECPNVDVAVFAGEVLARALLRDPDAADIDVRVVTPNRDRWTVAEVDRSILAAAAYIPAERTIVVVAAADMMDPAAAEHLLKTIEEPTDGTLFVFAVSDAGHLLSTVRGRAAVTVALRPAGRDAQVAALVDAGVDLTEAGVLVELVGGHGPLVAAVTGLPSARRAGVLTQLKAVLTAPLRVPNPTTAAVGLVRAAEAVIAATPGDGSASRGNTRAKAELRGVFRQLLRRWRADLRQEVRSAATAAEFSAAVRALEALDAAEADLTGYANPTGVLAALLNRTAPAPRN
jgi:hypothetical protein